MPELEFETVEPSGGAEDGSRVLVLLHGRGAGRRDLLGLSRYLPPKTTLVTPQAPFPGRPWGYGPGWAWYRYVSEDQVVDETLEESLSKLNAFLSALPEALPFQPGSINLGGFSQGGTTSYAFALRHPGRIPHVINLSGFLVNSPAVELSPATVQGTRFFWGHGERDPAIPYELAIRGRGKLNEVGADLTTFDHPSGHTITPDEIQTLVRWLTEGGEPS